MSEAKPRPGSRSLKVTSSSNKEHSSAAKLPRFSSPGLQSAAVARPSETSEFGAFVSPTTDLSKKLSFAAAATTPGRGIIGAGSVPMQVFCRVRPLKQTERASGPAAVRAEPPCTIRVLSDDEAAASADGEAPAAGSTFAFDRVFDDSTTQAEMYTGTFRRVVDSAVHRGSSGLLFAYGMTSAGKTFTISGNDHAPGLLPRVLHTVFGEIRSARDREGAKAVRRASGRDDGDDGCDEDPANDAAHAAAPSSPAAAPSSPAAGASPAVVRDDLGQRASDRTMARLTVAVSYLEVYNEGVFDLLSDMPDGPDAKDAKPAPAAGARPPRPARRSAAPDARRLPLRLKDGRDGRVHVRGLRTVTVPSLARALEIMQQGAANKRVAETRLNADSSRSHTVFTISLFRHDAAAEAGGLCLWSRLSVVDLAGCERAGRTGASGVRLREASNINRSLSALMQCLDAMRYNHRAAAAKGAAASLRVVPFRESKLTRLFSDSLSGSAAGAVVMVVNAGPAGRDRDETVQALRYGSVARDVRIAARVQGAGGAGAKGGPAYGLDGRRVRRADSSAGEGGDDDAEDEAAAATGGADENAGEDAAGAGLAAGAADAKPKRAGRRAGMAARGGRRRGAVAKAGLAADPKAGGRGAGAGRAREAVEPKAAEEGEAGGGASGEALEALRSALAAEKARYASAQEGWLEEKAALKAELEASREECEEAVAAMEAAQEEAGQIEAEVREEVVAEMEGRLASMQAEWADRTEEQEARADARLQRLLGIQQARTTAKKARATASRLAELGVGGEDDDEEDGAAGEDGDEPGSLEGELADAMRSAARHEAERRVSRRLSAVPGVPARSLRAAMDEVAEDGASEDDDEEEEAEADDVAGAAAAPVGRRMRLSSMSDGAAEDDGFAMAEALARAEAAEAEADELRAQVAECEAEAGRARERRDGEVRSLRDELEAARVEAAEAEAEDGSRGGSERERRAVARAEAAEAEVSRLRKRVSDLEGYVRRTAAMPLMPLVDAAQGRPVESETLLAGRDDEAEAEDEAASEQDEEEDADGEDTAVADEEDDEPTADEEEEEEDEAAAAAEEEVDEEDGPDASATDAVEPEPEVAAAATAEDEAAEDEAAEDMDTPPAERRVVGLRAAAAKAAKAMQSQLEDEDDEGSDEDAATDEEDSEDEADEAEAGSRRSRRTQGKPAATTPISRRLRPRRSRR